MNVAGAELAKIANDVADSAAGQKTEIFILGFVEECSKAGEHLYRSTADIITTIEEDGLHHALADAIAHYGAVTTHFTVDTFMNEVGGELAKWVTIPLTTGMMALGMEDQGNAMKEWIDGELADMSEALG